MTLSLGIRFPLVLVIELAVCDAERRGEPPVIDKRLGLDNWSFAQQ